MFRWLVSVLMLASPGAPAASERGPWADQARQGEGADPAPPPRIPERRDLLDELQLALGEWQREARGWLDAQAALERSRFEQTLPADEEGPGGAPERRPADGAWIEERLSELEARQQAQGSEADAEWERAAEAKRQARAEAIEAEARRMQAELNAARRREAEAQARQLGGSLDAEGNFVDPDLANEE